MKNFRIEFTNGLTFYETAQTYFLALIMACKDYHHTTGNKCVKLLKIEQL